MAAAAVVAGWALALDYSAKLFVMTFVIVLMTNETPDASDAFLIASTRVFGILLGVFLSLVLSVVVFPKSASHQVGLLPFLGPAWVVCRVEAFRGLLGCCW